MPTEGVTIGQQLEAALKKTGVSQRELGRRLAAQSGNGTTLESKRRWVKKVLDDEIERPDMAPIEEALELEAGWFELGPRQIRRRAARLERVEAKVAEVRAEHAAFVREVSGWRAEIETRLQELATQQSDQQSTRRSQ